MIYNTEGLILKEQPIGEKDRLVTVLTRDHGVIRCFASGAKNPKSSLFAPTQAMSFSDLTVMTGKSSSRITDAAYRHLFHALTKDIRSLALSQYFCELLIHTTPENVPSSDQLDLMLNCLYVLSEQKKPLPLIKAVFEVRLMILSGHMPNLIYCSRCGCYEADKMYFDCANNQLICASCWDGNGRMTAELSRGALTAFRYLTLSEPKKVFSFRLSDESLAQLAKCTEMYTLAVTESHSFSLTMYHQLQD